LTAHRTAAIVPQDIAAVFSFSGKRLTTKHTNGTKGKRLEYREGAKDAKENKGPRI